MIRRLAEALDHAKEPLSQHLVVERAQEGVEPDVTGAGGRAECAAAGDDASASLMQATVGAERFGQTFRAKFHPLVAKQTDEFE